jgi:hypothetical protein
MKRLALLSIVLSLAFALACGGSGGSSSVPVVPGITISPGTANLFVHQTTQFKASAVGMSSTSVTWSVRENKGGTVTSGLYQAPWTVGIYHVTATAVADPTKTATASVTVTAVTAFLETLPGGTSTPWSLTPILGTLRKDGTWETASVIDPNTNAPMDTSLYDVFLSADGTKAVGSTPQLDSQGHVAWNIVTFNADGSGMTSLTHNVPTSNSFVSGDLYPQLSPNGQLIAFSHNAGEYLQIWVMNADGSNAHRIASTACSIICVETLDGHPSFSPDGSKIVYDYWERLDLDLGLEGIATANADGTGTETPLTVNQIFFPGPFSDTRPGFTNDGSKIAFTRDNLQGSVSLFIMNPDGSNPGPLYDPGIPGTIAFQPRAVADRILFSSNVQFPGTNSFDIYSVMPDGSEVTRLTDNSIYDGFDESEMNYPPGGNYPTNASRLAALPLRSGPLED